jgi:NADH-quinone oxidoreductase subunit G
LADLLKVTIDGREVLVPKGTTIVEAARQVGIDIPVFCYHEKLPAAGACRMCLVEIEKVPRLQTACTTPVNDGMVVKTDTPAVDKARKGILEFLLTNHPLDCPVCDKGGECPLQDTTFKYACDKSRFAEEKRHFEKPVRLSDRIVLDRERCIMCSRCVRFQRDVAGDESLTLLNRGAKSMVGTLPGREFDSPFSGNTIELCPVGALTSAKFRFKARSWETKKTPSVCILCPVGCNLKVESRDGEVLRLTSRENPAVDDGWLCDWGRFTYDFVNDPARLSTPMVRKDGDLVPATWDEALDAVARGFRGAATGGLISPHATNEELYLFQKLFRTVLKSDNVDHGLHDLYSPLANGVDAATGTIVGLESAAVVVLAGADPLAKQPVLDLRLKKVAKKKGAALLTISSKKTDLAKLSKPWLHVSADGEAAVIKGLVRLLISDEMLGPTARERLGDQYDAVMTGVSGYAPEVVEEVSGIPAASLRDAAALLAGTTRVAVLFPRPVPGGPEGLREACEWLGAVTGGQNDPAGGIFPLSTAGNQQGAIDMGVVPNLNAGQRSFESSADKPGLSGLQMLDELAAGHLTALYVAGLDLLSADAVEQVKAAFSKVSFLVVQDVFLTATARQADVVLPAATFAEKDGTVTNLERRVQRITAAVACPGQARPDWRILTDVANAMGGGWSYTSAAEVFGEIVGTVPLYRGLGFDDLGPGGKRWRYPGAEEAMESRNGHERKLWYQPLQPQSAGA